MVRIETTNATIIPVKRMAISIPEYVNPNFNIFKRLAPNITGIAKKNVNSADTVRDAPSNIPPRIVAPEREVPGINANT